MSILRSQMNLCTLEIILGSQNWSDYIFQTISIYLPSKLDFSGIDVVALWKLVSMWGKIGGPMVVVKLDKQIAEYYAN